MSPSSLLPHTLQQYLTCMQCECKVWLSKMAHALQWCKWVHQAAGPWWISCQGSSSVILLLNCSHLRRHDPAPLSMSWTVPTAVRALQTANTRKPQMQNFWFCYVKKYVKSMLFVHSSSSLAAYEYVFKRNTFTPHDFKTLPFYILAVFWKTNSFLISCVAQGDQFLLWHVQWFRSKQWF